MVKEPRVTPLMRRRWRTAVQGRRVEWEPSCEEEDEEEGEEEKEEEEAVVEGVGGGGGGRCSLCMGGACAKARASEKERKKDKV